MEKLNQLELIAKNREQNFEPCTFADTKDILAIAEAFRELEKEGQKNLDGALAWQQRAEAAEAKLAELAKQEKQEPDYIRYDCGSCGYESFSVLHKNTCPECNHRPMAKTELFTRPAPAADLADLVPEKASMADYYENVRSGEIDPEEAGIAMWDACRAEMLRNIEEAK